MSWLSLNNLWTKTLKSFLCRIKRLKRSSWIWSYGSGFESCPDHVERLKAAIKVVGKSKLIFLYDCVGLIGPLSASFFFIFVFKHLTKNAFIIQICQWLDLNYGPLVLEATRGNQSQLSQNHCPYCIIAAFRFCWIVRIERGRHSFRHI